MQSSYLKNYKELFVDKFPKYWTPKQLNLYFNQSGHLQSIDMRTSKSTGHPFAILKYETHEHAQLECEDMNGAIIKGRRLTVKPNCLEKSQSHLVGGVSKKKSRYHKKSQQEDTYSQASTHDSYYG